MTDVATRTAYAPPQVRQYDAMERRAEMLADLRQFHDDHAMLEQKSLEQELEIAKLTEINNLLREQLRISRDWEAVAMRKLMRLSAHVATISTLSKEADEIVKDTKEWEEHWNQQEAETAVEAPRKPVNTNQADDDSEGVVRDSAAELPSIWPKRA